MEKLNTKLLDQNHKPGLYIVATPIGNILDISFRAISILTKAEYIFAEDTRQSRKLLDWYEIKSTKLIACHEYNETHESITSLIENQKIYALVSDAGTPAISDPGYKIVNWCLQHGIDVHPIPGASSFVTALCASGMPSDHFAFFGFLPPKEFARKKFLKNLSNESGTMIFFESPKRLLKSLKNMLEILGDRHCCVCRELTKIFEEFLHGTISEIIEHFSKNNPIGEFVILISGNKKIEINEDTIWRELSELLQKKSLKESVKEIADKYNLSKNTAYQKALELKNM
ncbi:MAG: 16S rRNA (cytidine(1402)-2'-O)-methyltransferase [Alphaproteobacteria bacterium]|nr:16S rRNA (cytidine(1402)-2'-O)-methyltransferase [Alphaproteobacteria bacterium]